MRYFGECMLVNDLAIECYFKEVLLCKNLSLKRFLKDFTRNIITDYFGRPTVVMNNLACSVFDNPVIMLLILAVRSLVPKSYMYLVCIFINPCENITIGYFSRFVRKMTDFDSAITFSSYIMNAGIIPRLFANILSI